MTTITKFAQTVDGLKRRENIYREDALRQAKERAREDRISMYRELYELVRISGVSIAKVCNETGIARSTIYRWLEEYEQILNFTPELEADKPSWEDVRLMPTGEVTAVDPHGDRWIFTEDAEAWNKTKNETFEGFHSWPLGAKEAFDSVRSA